MRQVSGVGRRAVNYEMDAEAGYVLGFDLGASTLRATIANIAGAVVADREMVADPAGGAALLAQIGQLKGQILAEAGVDETRLLQAAVAIPGVVDPVTGRLSLAPNLHDMEQIDVAGALRNLLKCKVTFENDVNAGAIGEYWETGQAGIEHFAFLSIGTGVGLGVLVEGKLLRGASRAAGEVGYLPLGADPFSPMSVERGALEYAIGAAGISGRFHMAGGAAGTSVREIFDRSTEGQRAAVVTLEETARLAALAVVAVCSVIDPAKVVMGVNIGGRQELVHLMREILPRCTNRPVPIEAGRLGPRASVVGAAAIALGELQNSLFGARDLSTRRDVPTGRSSHSAGI